jgi:hypothetical protein
MSIHQKREVVDETKLDLKPKECREIYTEMSDGGSNESLGAVKERRVLHIRE